MQRRTAGIIAAIVLLTALSAGILIGLRVFNIEPDPASIAGTSSVELQAEDDPLAGGLEVPETPDSHDPSGRVSEVGGDADQADQRLRGVVLDEHGRPIAGALVAVQRRPSASYSMLDLEYNELTLPEGSTRTDADGKFTLTVPESRPLEVQTSAPGHAPDRRKHVFGGEFLTIRLALAAILEGRIVTAEAGEPIEAIVLEGYVDQVRVIDALTDADGSFYFDDLPAGSLNFQIQPPFHEAPAWQTIELVAGMRLRRDFELNAGVTISGKVIDARSGAAIVGAEVGEGWFYQKTVRTDAEGRYVLTGFGGPGVFDVNVRAQGYGSKAHEFPYNDMPEEPTTLDFELEPGHRAHGIALGPDSKPLANVYVAGVASDWAEDSQRTDWQGARSAKDGTFILTSLNPDLRHQLLLQKEGYGSLVYDFPEREKETADLDLGSFTMGVAASLRGMCVSDAGTRLPNARVHLLGTNADRRRLDPEKDVEVTGDYTRKRTALADSLGRFQFADLAPGEYTLESWIQGTRDRKKQRINIAAGEQKDGVECVLSIGLALQGVVVAPDGTPLSQISIEARPVSSKGRSPNTNSVVGGRFQIVGLADEEYVLEATPHWHNWSEQQQLYLSVTTPAVRAGQEADIHIVLTGVKHISGQVLRADGTPAARMTVRAIYPGSERHVSQKNADADGRFTLSVPAGTVVTLSTGETEGRQDEYGYFEIEGAQPVILPAVQAGTTDVVLQL